MGIVLTVGTIVGVVVSMRAYSDIHVLVQYSGVILHFIREEMVVLLRFIGEVPWCPHIRVWYQSVYFSERDG